MVQTPISSGTTVSGNSTTVTGGVLTTESSGGTSVTSYYWDNAGQISYSNDYYIQMGITKMLSLIKRLTDLKDLSNDEKLNLLVLLSAPDTEASQIAVEFLKTISNG